ncbi:MAG: hypothetical protein UDB88_00970, partial [Faecalibacterium prausnitzii]|nr:hypothetical protein [Faecalibacterium prausnitzii]
DYFRHRNAEKYSCLPLPIFLNNTRNALAGVKLAGAFLVEVIIEACLIYPDEVIDRLARAFYPAILACWNSEEGQREFAAWQAEQVHLAGKEKQEVPAGELPAVHIILVCGFWQGTSGWAHPVFLFLINKMEQIGQYDHSNNYSKKKHGQSISGL